MAGGQTALPSHIMHLPSFRPFLCSSLFLLAPASGIAAPGDLDASFGTGGKVVTPVNITLSSGQVVSTAFGETVAVQSDGKIVVAGYFRDGTYRLVVFRYTSTGSWIRASMAQGR